MAERRPQVPVVHGNEQEHRRLLAQAINALIPVGQWSEWTPTLTFATPGDLSVAYTTQLGQVAIFGNACRLDFHIVTSTFTHTTASGALRITGIPFDVVLLSDYRATGGLAWQGITKASYTDIAVRASSDAEFLDFMASGSGQNASLVSAADMPTGGSVILHGSITYRKA